LTSKPITHFEGPIYPNNSQTFSTPDGPGNLNLINPNDVTVDYTIAWNGELPTSYSMRHGHETQYKMPKGTSAAVTNLGPYGMIVQFFALQGGGGGE